MTGLLKKYYPSLLVSIIIIWLSLSESGTVTAGKLLSFPNSDKVAHLGTYLFFTFIILINSSDWKITGTINYFMILIPIILGMLMEALQFLLTETRQAEFYDLLANITGVAVAVIFIRLFRGIFKPSKVD